MIHYVELNPDNERVIESYGESSYSLEVFESMPESMRENLRLLPGPLPNPVPDAIYWEDGEVKFGPPRPSDSHEFNIDTKQWVLNGARAWAYIRSLRDKKLAESDWVRLRAADLGEPVPQAWIDYRQALRDITDQPDPLNIVWPTPPV